MGIVEVAEGKGDGVSEEELKELLLQGSNFSQGGVAVAVFDSSGFEVGLVGELKGTRKIHILNK